MHGILFRMAFPFDIALPPDEGFIFTRDERKAGISCLRGKGRRLLSYQGDDFSWLTAKEGYKHLRVSTRRNDERITLRQLVHKSEGDSFSGGIIDYQPYTVIQLFSEVSKLDLLDDEDWISQTQQWLNRVIFDFVAVYRLVSNNHDIHQPSLDESTTIELLVSDDFKFSDEFWEGNFRNRDQRFNWGEPKRFQVFKEQLSEEKVNQLRALLIDYNNPTLPHRLILDAKEYSHVRGDHDRAIDSLFTALETAVQQSLLWVCQQLGINELPQTDKPGKMREVSLAIEKGNIRNDLLPYVEFVTKNNLKGAREYTLWYRDVYEPRKAILHQGRRGYSADDAEKAFNATWNFLQLIGASLDQCVSHRKSVNMN